ncbi:MAG: anthranilate phosphoribosyltransferase [Pseudomonadota bacterium]
MSDLQNHINKIQQDTVLTEEEASEAIRIMMQGDANEAQMEEFLGALADRGEAVSEITGAAKVMREMAAAISAPALATDCCGTGGDGQSTYNISTAVALVSAACGIPIAKHGNRAASSKSGAADVLEALGVNLDLSHDKLEQALQEIGFCFLMAPAHHNAMKYVVPVRKKMGRRTIFNLLGPLANPAGTQYQLIGVFDKHWLRPMAEVLNNLGTKAAWIVHGQDGLDEITTTTATDIVKLHNGTITEEAITPEDFGLPVANPEDIKGGDAETNAQALLDILNGQQNAYRDIVIANAAAVLMLHEKANSLKEAAKIAADSLDTGKAQEILTRYIAFSKEG